MRTSNVQEERKTGPEALKRLPLSDKAPKCFEFKLISSFWLINHLVILHRLVISSHSIWVSRLSFVTRP